MIRVTIPGKPIPKACNKIFMRGGRVGSFAPQKTKAPWQMAALLCRQAAPPKPLTGPLSLTLSAFIAPPESFSAKRRAAMIASGYPTGKPDLDNLLKTYLDIGTAAGWWVDDAQVVYLRASKDYAEESETTVEVVEVLAPTT